MGDSAPPPLRLAVVGGVAGGMSFAARARRLSESARITVFEKGPYVGYANCGIPYALGGIISSDEDLILQTPASIKARYNVDILHNTEVVSIDRNAKTVKYKTAGTENVGSIGYDKLILAQGAEPFRPPIPGADNADNVFTLQTIPDLQAVQAYIAAHGSKSVAMIGGGFIGLEAAESLHALGLKVSIIEYMPHVFPPVDQDIAEPLHDEIRRNGVDLHLNVRIQKIVSPSHAAKDTSPYVLLESGVHVPGDIILLVAGVRPRLTLATSAGLSTSRFGIVTDDHMQSVSDPDIYAVGDMAQTTNRITNSPQNLALAGPANRQGRLVADHVFERDVRYRGNVGTSVCRIFGVNVGLVGPSVTNLRSNADLKGKIEYVTVHPPSHAGYYPGAIPLTLKLAFSTATSTSADSGSEKSGKILGAQIIGKEGVDKRIDVLATAIQAGMSVFDLEHLELAYAPPFGSAKDPVNMAGFVASNVLRGDTEIVHAEDLGPESLQEYQVIDVRSPGEFARGAVVGAKLLPLNELRERLGEVDKRRKVLVYCQVGYRGYLAYRILKNEGFEVVNLDGGSKAVAMPLDDSGSEDETVVMSPTQATEDEEIPHQRLSSLSLKRKSGVIAKPYDEATGAETAIKRMPLLWAMAKEGGTEPHVDTDGDPEPREAGDAEMGPPRQQDGLVLYAHTSEGELPAEMAGVVMHRHNHLFPEPLHSRSTSMSS
ncbi:hypothetical protein BCR34DRAFT_597745 [Clohesyomyces aquaticus]|uniref:Rhodanese domain-containing protein n=1 Tax=Clohesyomyces aquaticus TaxID=1231657 RepID=A0A1Y2A2D1_9PLEO|nr:hypothetical protein BCR34DRAFT_597745 [Clohesyomyces aquaticus]